MKLTKGDINTLERLVQLAQQALDVGINFGITRKSLEAIKKAFEIAKEANHDAQ